LAYVAAVDGWNLAARLIPDWPRALLSKPSKQKRVKLPTGALPDSFHDSLARLLGSMAKPNPFEEGGRTRPLRSATIAEYRVVLLRFAADLAVSGIAASEITGVAVLYTPENAERGLKQMYERIGEKKTRGIGHTAGLLRSLANRDASMAPECRARVGVLAALISPPPQRCMTPKNRARLRALDQPGKLAQLLILPDQAHRKRSGRYGDALARETTLAIALFTICPVRVKNIARIHLEHNLQRFGDGRTYLRFEAEEVKNCVASEFELPPDLARMITRHVATRSPLMCPSDCDWLFPLRSGSGPVRCADLSTRISRLIRKEIGLEVNPHLFRHQAAKIWLDANPGSYEAVRRLLGHSDLSHTLNLYTGFETRAATREFADLVAFKRMPKRK
jgi:integrase